MEVLNKLYNNPLTGFQSADKLYHKAKKIDKNITIKLVKQFLAGNSTAQITKQVKRNKEYSTITSPYCLNNFQCDLMILPNPSQNKGYKYLLTVIDVYSRYAFVKAIKTKTGAVVLDAFKELIEDNGTPNNLNLDEGAEFEYSPFIKYCKDNDITRWVSNPEQTNKNAIIERFHRTLRNLILKYEVAKGKSYIGILQKLIDNYNSTEHRTIKHTPLEIWTSQEENEQTINKLDMPFSIGERVRHITNKKTFNKASSISNYTKTIYIIEKIEGQSIYLDGLTKPYRTYELVKAVGNEINNSYDKQTDKANQIAKIKRRLLKEGLD